MSTGPTTAELLDLIIEDIRAMPDTATVLRNTPTRSPVGGSIENFQPVTARVVNPAVQAAFPSIAPGTTPCRLTASILSGGNERNAAGELIATMGYTLTVPPDTDIKARDRISVAGSVFEVNAVKGAASWNLSDSATLTEIQS